MTLKQDRDLSKLPGKEYLHDKRPRRMVSLRLDEDLLHYFKKLSDDTGIAYQRRINMYLRKCAFSGRNPIVNWVDVPKSKG